MTRAFEEFWAASGDNAGFSTGDVEAFAQSLVRTCGAGSVLDVGCGNGVLVQALLRMGVDARGVDVSVAAIAASEREVVGRCAVGDGLGLDAGDGSAETVVCVGLIEYLDEGQRAALLMELGRVARRSVVVVTCGAAMLRAWCGIVPFAANITRNEIDGAARGAGLRWHRMMLGWAYYNGLAGEGYPRIFVYEKAAKTGQVGVGEGHGLADVLEQGGDAALDIAARYQLAAELVRRGDVVLDIAWGSGGTMGGGAAILAAASEAAGVVGVDTAPLEGAAARYGSERVHFQRVAAEELCAMPAGSIDYVTCIASVHSAQGVAARMATIDRVLSPGGRVVFACNRAALEQWGGEGWLANGYIAERAWEQVPLGRAGTEVQPGLYARPQAGVENHDGAGANGATDAEVEVSGGLDESGQGTYVQVLMKSPLGEVPGEAYRESMFEPVDDPAYHLYRFEREYRHPALFKSMVCIGPRLSSAVALHQLAQRVLAEGAANVGEKGWADRGAAACVLCYQALLGEWPLEARGAVGEVAIEAVTGGSSGEGSGEGRVTAAGVRRVAMQLANDYINNAADSPHAQRWVISLTFVLAQLQLAAGLRSEASASFERCAAMDALVFSPLLGTKTIDAARWAGVLAALDGNYSGAMEWWQRGVREAQRLVQASWCNVVGDTERPQPYGLYELAQVIDAASHCAGWLQSVDRLEDQPGFAWLLARRQTFGDTRAYIKQLGEAQRWLAAQLAARDGHADEPGRVAEVEAELRRVAGWAKDLHSGKEWLEAQVASLTSQHGEAIAQVEAQRRWSMELMEAGAWHKEQVAALTQQVVASEDVGQQLQRYNLQLQEGKAWLESQAKSFADQHTDALLALEESRKWSAQMYEGKTWLERKLQELTGEHEVLVAKLGAAEEVVMRTQTQAAAERADGVERARSLAAAHEEFIVRVAAKRDGLEAEIAAFVTREGVMRIKAEEGAEALTAARADALALRSEVERMRQRGLWSRIRNEKA